MRDMRERVSYTNKFNVVDPDRMQRASGHVGIERAKARTSVSAAAECLIQGYSCTSPQVSPKRRSARANTEENSRARQATSTHEEFLGRRSRNVSRQRSLLLDVPPDRFFPQRRIDKFFHHGRELAGR